MIESSNMTSTRSSLKEPHHSKRSRLFTRKVWETCWSLMSSKVRYIFFKQSTYSFKFIHCIFAFLDIAESDLIYTETLMQRGIENYEGKEICILGGGDGALLYELLKEKPKFVTMLEIDEMVMQVCNKYLRSICGDVLEKRKSDNFEVNY